MKEHWSSLKTGQQQRGGQPEFILLVDIIEGDRGYRLLCMLPGVDPALVSVEMDGRVLTISGERRFPALEEGERLESVESYHGFFSRQFEIPERADFNTIAARYEDGILEISIHKREAGPSRSIPITAAGD